MDPDWTVFVEGDSDQVLVRSLLQLIGVSDVRTEIIGGGVNHLESVQNQFHRARDVGYRVAMILDANSDPAQRIRDVDDTIKQLCLPVERYFLLPDGQHPGSLQTLLEQMAVPPHQLVYKCLDEYEICLSAADSLYHAPSPKGRVYAYCEALGIETRDSKRDYSDSSNWNLCSVALEPLKRFLSDLQL